MQFTPILYMEIVSGAITPPIPPTIASSPSCSDIIVLSAIFAPVTALSAMISPPTDPIAILIDVTLLSSNLAVVTALSANTREFTQPVEKLRFKSVCPTIFASIMEFACNLGVEMELSARISFVTEPSMSWFVPTLSSCSSLVPTDHLPSLALVTAPVAIARSVTAPVAIFSSVTLKLAIFEVTTALFEILPEMIAPSSKFWVYTQPCVSIMFVIESFAMRVHVQSEALSSLTSPMSVPNVVSVPLSETLITRFV